MQTIQFGMGCFWTAERLFWGIDGVWTTAVGFHGDHTEVVRVVFDPTVVSVDDLMAVFWANHDPAAIQSSLYASVVGSDDPGVLVTALASVDQRRSVGPVRTVLVDGHMTYAGPDQQQYLA